MLDLDAHEATDPTLVGAKAAMLARGRRAGMSVLPGIVVTTTEADAHVALGSAAVRQNQAASARRRVMSGPDASELVTQAASAAAEWDASTVVVRSSTRLEVGGEWAGIFSSFLDVDLEHVATAIRGCWASMFSPTALACLASHDMSVDDVQMAVLIQPYIDPDAGGWMRAVDDGVEIVAVKGHPGPLLGGHVDGMTAVLRFNGSSDDGVARLPIAPEATRALLHDAQLAGSALRATGFEWVAQGKDTYITQITKGNAVFDTGIHEQHDGRSFSALAFRRVARHLAQRQGILSERLVLPWIGALPESDVVPGANLTASVSFDDARRLAAELARQVSSAVGAASPVDVAERLLDGDGPVTDELARVSIDRARALDVLGAIDHAGDLLVRAGHLRSAGDVWRQSAEWIEGALEHAPPHPRSLGRFASITSEVMFRTIVHHGRRTQGLAAAPGRAAGRARAVRDGQVPEAGDVLIAPGPTPDLSPYLWTCSALATSMGSPAAHVCEIARSLRVPAVVGARFDPPGNGLVAVDGTTGEVWAW